MQNKVSGKPDAGASSRQDCYCELCDVEFAVPFAKHAGVWEVYDSISRRHNAVSPDCGRKNGTRKVRIKNCDRREWMSMIRSNAIIADDERCENCDEERAEYETDDMVSLCKKCWDHVRAEEENG